MKFRIQQRFTGTPDDVARAYADPDLYIVGPSSDAKGMRRTLQELGEIDD